MRRTCIISILQLIVLSAAISISTSAQTGDDSAQSNDAITNRVNEIIASTIEQGRVYTAEDRVLAYTFIPTSDEARAEIKKMGSKAVPALVQHLSSQHPWARNIAVRFLEHIGSKEAVKALGDVVLSSSDSELRYTALVSLSIFPWDSIAEYVLHAKNDPKPSVRESANKIEAVHLRDSHSR
jgi:HEAT repeat protein